LRKTYGSKIDLFSGKVSMPKIEDSFLKYTDSICNGLLIQRVHAENQSFTSKEEFMYNSFGKKIKQYSYPAFGNKNKPDSTIHIYNSDNCISERRIYNRVLGPIIVKYNRGGDTTTVITKHNDGYETIDKHYTDDQGRKCHIVVPSGGADSILDKKVVMIATTYNEHGDEIQVDKYVNGKFESTSLRYIIEYDEKDRKVLEKTYYGNDLGHIKIHVYE